MEAYIKHTFNVLLDFLREVCNFNFYGSLFEMILQFIYEASCSFSTEDFTAFELPWTPTFFSAFFYTVLPDGLILYNGMKLFLAFFTSFCRTSVFTRYFRKTLAVTGWKIEEISRENAYAWKYSFRNFFSSMRT